MRPRRSEAEESILAAAMELLAQAGYDRMSMDLVARRAKTSKATIYRRWTGKADLVHWAITRQTGQVIEPPEPTGTLRGDLLELLSAVHGSALDAYRWVTGFPQSQSSTTRWFAWRASRWSARA